MMSHDVRWENLNPAQQQAVTQVDGPVMVLAGAGSGKTRTLVHRIQYLLDEKQIAGHQLLAVTFSNKAAREMRERVAHQTGHEAGSLQITTFHAFCANILRKEFVHLGLSRNFTIYDESESRAVVKNILGQRGINLKETSPYEVLGYFNELKNIGHYPGREMPVDYPVDQGDPYYGMFLEYESELHRSNAVDFGGLIVGVIKLFEKFPNVLANYQTRYQYILVDEYQDTNRAQFELLCLLSEKHHNLCVVGDEDQSIYSWRGADIRNILEFEKRFTDVQTVKLEQNYRSSKNIIEAASFVISQNQMRKGKEMWTDNDVGQAIEVVECKTDKEEAEFIVKEIAKLLQEAVNLEDVAVFYRNNSQSRILEDQLRKLKIPYRIVAGIKFYERKEIKDLLAYVRLVVNPKDSLALGRIINVPARGIGATSLRKLEMEAISQQCSLWDIVEDIVNNSEKYSHLKLSRKIKSALTSFECLISEVKAMNSNGERPSVLVEKLAHESGYIEAIRSAKDYESQARLENIEELFNGVGQFEETASSATLVGYLESITLDTHSEEKGSEQGEVSLMTVHGSKGLEFPYVFISGAEENLFPSYRSLEAGAMALEEERRLFYVAMTRAMKKLWICFANGRMLFGGLKFNGPSRFIFEIPEDYLKWKKVAPQYYHDDEDFDFSDEYSQASSFDEDQTYIQSESDAKFKKGDQVIHGLYGEGLILNREGFGGDEKVMIQFSDGSKKKFMVKFAPLTRV